jgi:ribosomal protein S18 acetylase RimI-like enzyme
VTIIVRSVRNDEREWLGELIRERWGADVVVGHGVVHRPAGLAGLVAEEDGKRIGLITYHVDRDACEIVTIDALEEGRGVGTALVDAVTALGHARVWLITTNDNVRAQRFYERRGFRLVARHEGAVGRSRKLKPEIPELADDGTPIRDELEYERRAT